MEDFVGATTAGFLLGFIVACITVGVFATQIEKSEWRRETINRGFAEYNNLTGEWQWKEQGQ